MKHDVAITFPVDCASDKADTAAGAGLQATRLPLQKRRSAVSLFSQIRLQVTQPPLQSSTLGVNGFQLANVLCRKVPVFGTVDDQLFVIVTGQRRIELQVPKIECDEKRTFRVAVRPHVLIFASVLVLVVRFSGSIAFSFVEVFQFAVGEFINDAPNIFRLIRQDIRDATIAPGRFKRKCQPMGGQFCPANKFCQWASLLHLRPIKV